MNLNLIRQLSKAFDTCDNDVEARVILDAIAQLTSDTPKKLSGFEFDAQVMAHALTIKEKCFNNDGYSTLYYRVGKIPLIKYVRDLKGWGLKETKDYVESLPLRFN